MDQKEKERIYREAKEEIMERLENTVGIIPRMATVSAVLKSHLPYFFWCGFYFAEEEDMVIGPYQGTTACPNIAYSGVCGTAAKKKKTIIVPDVHKFPGHIPCDERSKSEIVTPVLDSEDRIIAVFDVDSTELNSFDSTDKKHLEEIMPILLEK